MPSLGGPLPALGWAPSLAVLLSSALCVVAVGWFGGGPLRAAGVRCVGGGWPLLPTGSPNLRPEGPGGDSAVAPPPAGYLRLRHGAHPPAAPRPPSAPTPPPTAPTLPPRPCHGGLAATASLAGLAMGCAALCVVAVAAVTQCGGRGRSGSLSSDPVAMAAVADVALDPLALCRQLYAELERLEAGEAVRFPDFIAALQATGAAEGKVAALRAVHHGRFPDDLAAAQELLAEFGAGVHQPQILAERDKRRALKPDRNGGRRQWAKRHPFAANPVPVSEELPAVRKLGMPKRYRMVLAYDGRAFFGWERQGPAGRPTVQWTVEAAHQVLLR
eukprot:EG_transcript_19220